MAGKKPKKCNPILHPFASINALISHLPLYSGADPKTELIISNKKLTESIRLISIYGNDVFSYINHSLVYPANNPKAFADQITKDVIGKVFPPDFHPEFNQYVSISTSLLFEKLEELAQSKISLLKAIEKMKNEQEEFVTHEIDAVIYVNSAEMKEKWMEIKLFTCPNQSAKVINRLLQPKEMKSYFLKNDYLGLMGFSLICTKDGVPVPYQKIPPIGLEGMSSWMIHLLLFDQGVCEDPRSTNNLGEWILEQIQAELDEMTHRLDLNKYDCFFRMTENFVKVVRMAQLLEEYKEELTQARKAKEEERKAKEEERKAKENALKRIAELEKELAKYKKK
jgi:hypothetical protein